jgi:hypothetical protein
MRSRSAMRTGTGRREHLVTAEDQEIAVEVRHVNGRVRDGLRRVDQNGRAGGVRLSDDLPDRVHRSKAVGGVCDREELRALLQLGRELVAAQPSVLVDVDHHDLRAHVLRQLLPGDEVRVMLEDRRDDAVPGLDVVAAPGVRNEVHALGRVAHEDDLAVVLRADELRDLRARALERGGRRLAELVHAAVDVRVVLLEDRAHRVDHLSRLLARRRVVEVHDGLAVDRARQDREVGPDPRDVERRALLRGVLDGDGHAQAFPA